jgi:hypothetical protein
VIPLTLAKLILSFLPLLFSVAIVLAARRPIPHARQSHLPAPCRAIRHPFASRLPHSTIPFYFPSQPPTSQHRTKNTRELEEEDEDEDGDGDEGWTPHLVVAQPLLTSLDPQTLTFIPDPREHMWKEYELPKGLWDNITSNWTRLTSVRFDNTSCYVLTNNDVDEETYSFFPGLQSPFISFTWMFSPGIYRDAMRENVGGSVLQMLQNDGVFRHPTVRAKGIELVVGGEEETVAAVKEDIERLDEENRSLVRCR